jgi:hypothetical protein
MLPRIVEEEASYFISENEIPVTLAAGSESSLLT